VWRLQNNAEKRQDGGHGDQKSVSQNDKPANTHERLAEEYKVSPATITRDGNYAAAVDTGATHVPAQRAVPYMRGDEPVRPFFR